MQEKGFAGLTFPEAAPLWLETRVKIGERTRQDYVQHIRNASKFFNMKLEDIHIGHIYEYQNQRKKTVKPLQVNKEVCTVLQVRRRAMSMSKNYARDMDDVEKFYEPLPLPKFRPPQTISNHDEERFLAALRSKEAWEMVYCYALIALNTGMRGCEIRGLRIGDVDLNFKRIVVTDFAAKNNNATRVIPMIGSTQWAVERALQIAHSKGSRAPHHFLFPFREKFGLFNPEKPMTYSGMKKPWMAARKLSGVRFRPHGSRHQFNTKMAESGAPNEVRLSIVGHESEEMNRWYMGIRPDVQRKYMEKAFSSVEKIAKGVSA